MKHRRTTHLAIALAAVVLAAHATAQPPEVRAARRAERFDDRITVLTPRNKDTDVVLLVELAGITQKEFEAIPAAEIYLRAGEARFDLSFRVAGDWEGGAKDRWLVFLVPRAQRAFSLHCGSGAPTTIEATAQIVSTLP